MSVSLNLGNVMVIIAWVFFVVGVLLLLPLNVSVLGLSPTVCFLGCVASKMLA